ncbi:hypothetical protein GYA28_01495 [Candidatus Roizmanbacteria bacterium]|jgi:hypothetical protein|nr:hypothetical protein [Candidatus Roizmanbacteria bacterium]
MVNIELSRQVKQLFKSYQEYRPADQLEAYDNAQLSIAYVVQAMAGIASEDKIIQAIGNAKSSNGVSRGLRHRFPSLASGNGHLRLTK